MSFLLSTIRHSASHILAQAVLHLFPDAKLGIGPSIEEGFYYDFDLDYALTDQDLEKIEQVMKDIISQRQSFKQYNLPRQEAENFLKERDQDYKLEIIQEHLEIFLDQMFLLKLKLFYIDSF